MFVPLNVTVIGDGTAGIMHMLVTYAENRFPEDYCPSVVDSPSRDILIDGTMVRLNLWPAPGLSLSFAIFYSFLKVISTISLIQLRRSRQIQAITAVRLCKRKHMRSRSFNLILLTNVYFPTDWLRSTVLFDWRSCCI